MDFKNNIEIPECTNVNVWLALAVFGIFQMFLQKFVPGKEIFGPLTESGHRPRYIDNGLCCYFITLFVYFVGIYLQLWNGGILIDYCGPVIIRLNLFALVFCWYILYKGYYNPTTKDVKISRSIFSDYFWGTDLYPKMMFGLDIKVWTNCRMGMTMWPLIVLSCCFYQVEQYGYITGNMFVNATL